MSTKYLSKSAYMAGTLCPRKLWQIFWDRESASPIDGMSMLMMDMGVRFGRMAHEIFPTGKLINVDVSDLEDGRRRTKRAIEAGESVLFEGVFQSGRCRILADVVERLDDGSWHLIEVKSSTAVKNEHIADLAYQKYVMDQAGYPVARCSVIHSNKEGVWPEKKSIFSVIDETERVSVASEAVEMNVESMLRLTEENPPDPRACYSKECHKCEFKKNVCWKGVDAFTIYDVVDSRKIPALEAEGTLYVRDIPTDFEMPKKAWENISRIQNKRVDIDQSAISDALASLEYPLYFLDFESVALPVPMFEGTSPWQKLAFQYSLHIQHENGQIEHREFLHTHASDPSGPLMRSMLENIGGKGSIIVYHAGMESGVIKDLSQRFPEHAPRLTQMLNRIWDLELIFKQYYRDWRFGTKSSIKVVLPELCPQLSYKDLQIQEGGSASKAWVDFIESEKKVHRDEIAAALKDYCTRDTLAMVELLKVLNLRGTSTCKTA